MTMASRDIANMHLFLDLKKKFPDLPDDTIRSYVSLYGEDQEKCMSLLQREYENHYHPSQPFADFRLCDKASLRKSENLKSSIGSLNEGVYSAIPSVPLQHSEISTTNNRIQVPSGRSTSHAGIIHSPGLLLNPNVPSKPEPHSAPVITKNEKPFNQMYKQTSVSSHSSMCQTPSDRGDQMIFSTTKEHIISPPVSHNSTAFFPIPAKPKQPKRHAVELSITPSFPFQQQHINIFNNSVCATASHSSRPGRHTTSLNFQLQPQSSDQYPLEISTIPTNIGSPCDSRDFASHVQISVGSQGATFTALRLQRPNYSQSPSHLPVGEDYSRENIASSQTKNSNLRLIPEHRIQPLPTLGANESFKFSKPQNSVRTVHERYPSKNSSAHRGSIYNYQTSPDYILAVKNHQIAQLDLILNELEKEKAVCSKLKAEVEKLEQEVTQRNATKASFLYAEELELNKLREENRRLRIECNCLLMEVDMCSTGQIPLGVTDEDFYSSIFTGPNGAISSAASKGTPSMHKERLGNKSTKKPSFEEDEENHWICKKCTFANHPALEKCEICEMPKSSGSFFDDN